MPPEQHAPLAVDKSWTQSVARVGGSILTSSAVLALVASAMLLGADWLRIPSRTAALESAGTLHAQQILDLQIANQQQAERDAKQDRVLDFLACSQLHSLGLEDRTPRQCAAEYLKVRL